ncbi:LOW QUALITY PROTEIN: antiviral innate immune response receptor RIG-I [Leptosomus discolor]
MAGAEKRSLQSYRRYTEKSPNPVYVLGTTTDWLPDGEGPAAPCCPRSPAPRSAAAELPAPGRRACSPPPLCACFGFLLEGKGRVRKEEEEGEGVTAAAALSLGAAWQLEAEGWRRGCRGCRSAAGCTGLAEAIENWDFSKPEKLELHRQLLKKIEAIMLEFAIFLVFTVHELKKAWSYQTELAQPDINGKNTLICSPTGSGKTFVAFLICDHHFQNMPSGKAEVVFLATKVYEQKMVFKQHFERSGYSVQGISGETVANVSVEKVVQSSDIIVLTPQILVNSIKEGILCCLSIFTLMIFDECHNTTGNHPYNVLVTKYLEQKFDSSANQLPQIVGLTASVGVGNAKTIKETIEHICTLCCYLGIEAISTVRENKQDLQRFTNKPETYIQVKIRVQNHFADIISSLMSETEVLMRKIYSVATISQINKNDFGTQKYEQWIVTTQKKCRLLQLADKDKESSICRDLFICTEHLQKFNDALINSEEACIEDALTYPTEFFTNVKNGPVDLEKQLTAKFQKDIHDLQMKEKVLRDFRKKETRCQVVERKKNLLCGKCKACACSTDDIRVIKESHHILGDAFKEHYIIKPHEKPVQFDCFEKKSKMHFQNTNCHHDWGVIVKYKAFDNLPVIKIKSFVVENIETGTQMDFQTWKNISFSLKNLDVGEMCC